MLILFFDTETTGINHYSRIVQLGYALYENETLIKNNAPIINSEGNFSIPSGATKKHGITDEISKKNGVLLSTALNEFFDVCEKADLLVAHNAEFDVPIIENECKRLALTPPFKNKNIFCTLQATIDYCKRPPFKYGKYKYPTLTELHQTLFDLIPENTHTANGDINILSKCFFELRKKGIINL